MNAKIMPHFFLFFQIQHFSLDLAKGFGVNSFNQTFIKEQNTCTAPKSIQNGKEKGSLYFLLGNELLLNQNRTDSA